MRGFFRKIRKKIGRIGTHYLEQRCSSLAKKDVITAWDRWSTLLLIKVFLNIRKNQTKSQQILANRMEIIRQNLDESQLMDKDKVKRINDDMLFCTRVYGFNNQEYFTYELEKLSHTGRQTFVSTRNKYKYYYELNNQNYTTYLNKKTEMYRKFKEYYGRDAFAIYDETDRDGFVEFVKKHPKFIYKPSDDHGGNGIQIINTRKSTGARDIFDILISQGNGIVEELIEQSDELAQFHPKSVNTVRAVTYLKSDGNIEIAWCFLRMGMGGSHTDNMGSGGLSAMIDPETGIIISLGRDYKGDEHMSHPDTGIQLVGFKLPEWESAKKMLKEVAHVIPQLRFVGWDLAYSNRGWVLIEGNSRPQCVAAQISYYNGKLHVLDRVMEDYIKQKESLT